MSSQSFGSAGRLIRLACLFTSRNLCFGKRITVALSVSLIRAIMNTSVAIRRGNINASMHQCYKVGAFFILRLIRWVSFIAIAY